MNISKFTQKSMEIVNNLEKTAYDFGNQELAQEHLFGGRFWSIEEIKNNLGKGVFTPNFESEFARLKF